MKIYDPGLTSSVESPTQVMPKLTGLGSAGSAAGQAVDTFGQMLKDSLARVNDTQAAANRSVERLVSGEEPNIHKTMLAMEEASLSLKLATQVRNKVLEAYQDLMKTPV